MRDTHTHFPRQIFQRYRPIVLIDNINSPSHQLIVIPGVRLLHMKSPAIHLG
jgi:hypothetical protein